MNAASWEVYDAAGTSGLETKGYRYAHVHRT